jgi:hypothetical protein
MLDALRPRRRIVAMQSGSLEQSPSPTATALGKAKQPYVDLTVVTDYVQGLLILAGVVMLWLALAIFG